MDTIFGEAPGTMPTPATQAERGSLMGVGSPVPSLDIPRGPPLDGIPRLDIDQPSKTAESSKYQAPEAKSENNGVGGWITRMFQGGRGGNKGDTGRGVQYRRLEGGADD